MHVFNKMFKGDFLFVDPPHISARALLLTKEYIQLYLFNYMVYGHTSIYLTGNYHLLSFTSCLVCQLTLLYPIAKKITAVIQNSVLLG